jgi:D-sedoheptulose 7-phosphate isomerase
MNFINKYLDETANIISQLDQSKIKDIIDILVNTRNKKGRVFFIGVGGSAGNASHAVNDFRKIGKFECYAPTDNISELTARTNDEGWEYIFSSWLLTSNLNKKDLIFIFSVGGGNIKQNISVNIVNAIKLAKKKKSKIIGILGKKNGYAAKFSDTCLIIPEVNKNHTTPHSESFQTIVWHLIISHPKIKVEQTKWESLKNE